MFSATVQEHTYQPRNVGELPSATHHGVAGVPGDGPYMLLWFEVVGDTIVKATYDTTDALLPSQAEASRRRYYTVEQKNRLSC